MADKIKLTKEDFEEAAKIVYHHVDCSDMKGVKLEIGDVSREQRRIFGILGLSSKEKIKTGLQAVDASPFKTVFVVSEKSGEILFALSKNTEYVAFARKKKPKPPPPPPPPQPSRCCQLCFFSGGYACDQLSDGSCICYGADRGGAGGNIDDPLEVLTV